MLLSGGGCRTRLKTGEVGLDPSVDLFVLIVQARREMAQTRLNPAAA